MNIEADIEAVRDYIRAWLSAADTPLPPPALIFSLDRIIEYASAITPLQLHTYIHDAERYAKLVTFLKNKHARAEVLAALESPFFDFWLYEQPDIGPVRAPRTIHIRPRVHMWLLILTCSLWTFAWPLIRPRIITFLNRKRR